MKNRMRKSHGNNARTLIKTFNVNPVHSGNCLCKTYLVSCDLYFRIYISHIVQQFEPGNQSELSLIQLQVFRQQSISKFCCNGESRKPLHFWLNVSGSSRPRLASSGARAILKFWLRATAFVNLRQKCPKWQNWATLSCDMHLDSGCCG